MVTFLFVNSNWGNGNSAAVFYANSYHVGSHVILTAWVTGITVNVSFYIRSNAHIKGI